MNDTIREYIETRIPEPRFDIPRWRASAPAAGVDTLNIDFGNTYQGVYIFALVLSVPGGLAPGTINNAQGIALINATTAGISSINNFEYVMFERRLILTSSVLTLTFSVGFQYIAGGTER